MSNPQQSGSQPSQGTQREKEGTGHQQQQQPGSDKSIQHGDAGKQGHQQPQHGDTGQRNK
jgi:hypothetical protein